MGIALSGIHDVTITAMHNWTNPGYGKSYNVQYITSTSKACTFKNTLVMWIAISRIHVWLSIPCMNKKTVVMVIAISRIHDMPIWVMFIWKNYGYVNGYNLQCMTCPPQMFAFEKLLVMGKGIMWNTCTWHDKCCLYKKTQVMGKATDDMTTIMKTRVIRISISRIHDVALTALYY